MQGIFHGYYTVALAPPVAAVTGMGAAVLWAARRRTPAAVVLAVVVVVTEQPVGPPPVRPSRSSPRSPRRPRTPVMAIGGFNGTDPAPSLARFQRYVSAGRIHYFAGGSMARGGGNDPAQQIAAWVAQHFTARTVGGTTVYDLSASQ